MHLRIIEIRKKNMVIKINTCIHIINNTILVLVMKLNTCIHIINDTISLFFFFLLITSTTKKFLKLVLQKLVNYFKIIKFLKNIYNYKLTIML